jgi:hypothetical protein
MELMVGAPHQTISPLIVAEKGNFAFPPMLGLCAPEKQSMFRTVHGLNYGQFYTVLETRLS